MPKRAAEQYENDDGFVEDAPRGKKSKQTAKVKPNLEMQKDGDGNPFWQLSGKRRVQVSSYKGAEMVNIREFYEKDGEMKPGSKGITMTIEQYNAVVQLLPQIEGVLKKRGATDVARPDYSASTSKTKDADDDEEEEEEAVESGADEEEEEPVPKKKKKSKLNKFNHPSKKNHEATSDEED